NFQHRCQCTPVTSLGAPPPGTAEIQKPPRISTTCNGATMTTMSTPADILLYGSPISTFVRKVQLLLEHKGLDYRMEMPDRDRLLAMNPLGKVPVLSHGGEVIVDSSVICD